VRPRVDTVDLQIQIKEHEGLLTGLHDVNVKQQEAFSKVKKELKEKAKASVLEEFVETTITNVEGIKHSVDVLGKTFEASSKVDKEAVATLKEELQRSINTAVFGVKQLREDMKYKVSSNEVTQLKDVITEVQGKIQAEIPKLQKQINEKAAEEALSSIKTDFIGIIDGLSHTLKDSSATMLGGRAYCLSCQQPVKISGPESETNSKKFIF
jgi:hypothetical protein